MSKEDFSKLPGDFFTLNEVWRSLFAQATEKNEFIRNAGLTVDPMVEISSLDEFLQTLSDSSSGSCDQKQFLILLKMLGITQDARTASTIMKAIRTVDSSSVPDGCIAVPIVLQFVETWQSVNKKSFGQLTAGIQIPKEEEIIKALPLVRVLEKKLIGTLILTSKNLLFAPNDSKLAIVLSPIPKITKIEKKQLAKSRSNDQALIVYAADRPATTERQSGSKVVIEVTQLTLLFFNERDEWSSYLTEMQRAYQAADVNKDTKLISKAARNIALVDTVAKVSVAAHIWSCINLLSSFR